MADASPSQEPPEPELVFPVQFGRYTLLKRLGEGGMGEIFLASLQGGIAGVEKICVIKKLRRMFSHDDEFVARFLDEARLMVQLNHANIVPVFDAGTINEDYFLAMELVDGLDLRELNSAAARRGQTMPAAHALFVIREVLGALAYAHNKKDAQGNSFGLVHRDISPQNILISVNGEVKLIDFGLAKSTQKVLKTDPRVVLGKYAYMSPEQARGQPVDGRSDLFAIGLLLFELIANRKLWDGVTVGELMEQIAEHRVFSPGKVMRGVDPEVDALVDHALLKDVTKRFQTAEEFRDAVSHVLSRLAPTISPDTLGAAVRRARAELAGTPVEPAAPAKVADEFVDADPTQEASMEEIKASTQVVRPRTPSSTARSTTQANAQQPEPPATAPWKLALLGLGIGATVVGVGFLIFKLAGGGAPTKPPSGVTSPNAADAPPRTGGKDPGTPGTDDGVAPSDGSAQKAPAKASKPKPKPRKKVKKKR